MKLRVLGCSGAEFPGHRPTAFLLDDSLLVDAGTVGAALSGEEQARIAEILVTHPHLDHVRGIPLLAENMILNGFKSRFNVISTGENLAAIHAHLLNGLIWPDFTRIPSQENPVLSFREIPPEEEFSAAGFRITAFAVNHSVPAVGFRISKGPSTLIYTGDTGPTLRIWEMAGKISALLVEVSFPNEMKQIALMTGHLTPSLLGEELLKLKELPPRILITHLKPYHRATIEEELNALGVPGIEVLVDGQVYQF
jgi:ribonuclease BN (tRNA processing enzyme)